MSTIEPQIDTEMVEDEPQTPARAVLRRAWGSVPEFRIGWKKTFALALFGAFGRLVVPLLIRQAIDKGFRDKGIRLGYIVVLCLAGIVGLLATAFSNQRAVVRLGTTSEHGLAVLRERSVQKILDLSLQQHGEQKRGVLVARVTSDVESLSEFFSWSAVSWITYAVVMAVVGLAMLLINWRLAFVTFAITAFTIPFMRHMQNRLRISHADVREHTGSYLGQVSEMIGGASLIRAYRAESLVRTSTIAASRRRRDASVKGGIQSAILGLGNEVFQVATIVAVILVGLSFGSNNSLSAGTLIGFIFLVSRFLEPLGDLSEVMDQTQRAAAGMSRVLDLLDMRAEVLDPPISTPLPTGPLAIELTAVSFSYPVRFSSTSPNNVDEVDTGADSMSFAIKDLHLNIEAGSTVAIVGATGSGKSTLAKLLVRTADPTSGEIRIGGVALASVAFADLRRRVQLVPQDPFLFDTTIGANIALADPSLDPSGQLAVFDEIGIGDWVRSLPLGLDTEVGERGALLSAGERQLVVLARTRACNPDVLVLDEATSSVDASTEARLAETIMQLASKRTTVVIAHRLTTASRADRVLVMQNGVIVEDGTPEQLSNQPNGHYARLWEAWQMASFS